MKNSAVILFLLLSLQLKAQDNISPAKAYAGITFIKNGTVHTGTGTVLQNTSVQIRNGKIEKIGANLPVPSGDARIFDATGMDVYPGFILSDCNIGLREMANQVKGTDDYNEIGDLNPSVRSI